MIFSRLNGVRVGDRLFDLILDAEGGTISLVVPSGGGHGEIEMPFGTTDAGGLLYLPTLADRHTHLDKHLLGEPWTPRRPFVTLARQLAFEKETLASHGASVAERARRMLDRMLDKGTTRIRTHIDVDPQIGLSHLEDVLMVREEYRGRMEIEIVAFPQQGLLRSGSLPVMKEAMRAGADLVGGVDPAGLDRQLERSLEAMFELSAEFDAGIDLHLHDPGHLGAYTIERFAELTVAAGKGGRAAVSHAYGLGQISEAEARELADRLREAGVEIVTSVPIDRPMPRADRLLAAGVRVGVGTDNVNDAWSPYGDGDMLARASRLAEKLGWIVDDDMRKALGLVATAPLEPVEGAPATFMLVDALNPMHALASVPSREAVFANGRLVGGRWAKREG